MSQIGKSVGQATAALDAQQPQDGCCLAILAPFSFHFTTSKYLLINIYALYIMMCV